MGQYGRPPLATAGLLVFLRHHLAVNAKIFACHIAFLRWLTSYHSYHQSVIASVDNKNGQKICTSFAVLKDKMLSASGRRASPLNQGLCLWTPLGSLLQDPRSGLALHARHISPHFYTHGHDLLLVFHSDFRHRWNRCDVINHQVHRSVG